MGEDKIFDLFMTIVNDEKSTIQKEEICNMSLDDILDKMIDQGVNSLTELEKQKLQEYSK